MITRLLAAYPPKPDAVCVSTHTDPEFHIFDPPPPAEAPADGSKRKRLPCQRRFGEPQEEDIRVQNVRECAIHLVAIDNCLYTSGDPTRCDGALICDEEIRFVEFSHGRHHRRSERVEKCIPQLAATITRFHALGIIPDKAVVQAIVCVGFTEEFPPRTAQLNIRSAQLNAMITADVAVELHVTDTTSFA